MGLGVADADRDEDVCSRSEAVVEATGLYPTTNGVSCVDAMPNELEEIDDGDTDDSDDWYPPKSGIRDSTEVLVDADRDRVPFPGILDVTIIPAEDIKLGMLVIPVTFVDELLTPGIATLMIFAL